MGSETVTPKVYDAICGVMKDIGAVGKNQENKFQRYRFRGIDDVYNALQPAMTKNHLIIVPKVLESKTETVQLGGKPALHVKLNVQYDFICAQDGSGVSANVVSEAMDQGDKATSKALSMAFKYAAFQMFCIPTEDTPDGDRDTYQIASDAEKIYCTACKEEIVAVTVEGKTYTPKHIAKAKKGMCPKCFEKHAE